MKIRPFKSTDLFEVVKMYQDLMRICYPEFEQKDEKSFTIKVLKWICNKHDLIVAEDKGELIGFSLSYVETFEVLEPFYYVDIIYIKKEYRKTKAAYLLYKNAQRIALHLNLHYIGKALTGEPAEILQKRGMRPIFTEFKGLKHEIEEI